MIRLQFVCENALSSRVIAWFSQGHFSHVDAVGARGELWGARSDLAGATAPGVQFRPAHYAPFVTRVTFDLETTRAQQKKFWAFIREQIGKPYDRSTIWGFVRGRDWRQADSWICSELQAAALEYCGALPKLYIAANKITPVMLSSIVSAIGATATEY